MNAGVDREWADPSLLNFGPISVRSTRWRTPPTGCPHGTPLTTYRRSRPKVNSNSIDERATEPVLPTVVSHTLTWWECVCDPSTTERIEKSSELRLAGDFILSPSLSRSSRLSTHPEGRFHRVPHRPSVVFADQVGAGDAGVGGEDLDDVRCVTWDEKDVYGEPITDPVVESRWRRWTALERRFFAAPFYFETMGDGWANF